MVVFFIIFISLKSRLAVDPCNDANGMYVGKLRLRMLLIGAIWICKNPILILLVLIETQLSFIFLFPDYSFPESIPELSSPEVSLFS